MTNTASPQTMGEQSQVAWNHAQSEGSATNVLEFSPRAYEVSVRITEVARRQPSVVWEEEE